MAVLINENNILYTGILFQNKRYKLTTITNKSGVYFLLFFAADIYVQFYLLLAFFVFGPLCQILRMRIRGLIFLKAVNF